MPAPIQKKSVRRHVNHVIRLARFIVVKTIWTNVLMYVVLPIATLLGALYYEIPLLSKTAYLAGVLHTVSILAVTAGYHRLWSHHSYILEPLSPLPLFFAIFGSAVGLESAHDFSTLHKLHHKYCDTEKDPHNFRKNFVWAHIGWRLMRNRKLARLLEEEGASKVPEDGLLAWQAQYNFALFVVVGLVLPWIVARTCWGDPYGGLIYAGILRAAIAQQSLFAVNSLGHVIGSQPFEDKKTPRDLLVVSLLTFGEGYNNFHHQFPNDYRNGHYYYRHDPTKWFLNLCLRLGLGIKLLRRTNYEMIQRVGLVHQQKLLDRHRAKLNWGVPVNKLPLITVQEFRVLAKSPKRALVIINGVVHDVTPFVHNHPGGVALIKSSIGKDATAAFNGAVYAHSNAANNLLATMRIALIKDENTNRVIRENRTGQTSAVSRRPAETADAA